MDLHSMSRKLVVLAFAAALLAGFAATANATITIVDAELVLVGDEEAPGALGNGMVSIDDTIEVRVVVDHPESVLYVIADLRKYGGDEAETLYTFQGEEGGITSAPAWVPTCSSQLDGGGDATMDGLALYDPWSTAVLTEHWTVCLYDTGDGTWAWQVQGSYTGVLSDLAYTDSLYYGVSGGDTLFTFTVIDTADICCTVTCTDCDHFEFETYEAIQPDSTFTTLLVVKDGGIYWIDNTPCDYIGHTDPSVLITAVNVLYPDSMFVYDIDTTSVMPEDEGGMPVDYDTHHTTYAIVSDPGGSGAEFIEYDDYDYVAMTESAGLYPTFGWPDNFLNPTSLFGFDPDTLYTEMDMRRLSHPNGNDDIYHVYWDAHILGFTYSDTSLANVDSLGWWIVNNPFYGGIDCPTEYNGVTGLWYYGYPIMPGSTDVAADTEFLTMKWISDSGDTTYFPGFSRLIDAAIDNIIPAYNDTTVADSVMAEDIVFYPITDIAGDPDLLNPVSVGFDEPDSLQVQIDLAGLYDVLDIMYGFADMMNIGWDQADTDNTPFGWDYVAPMDTLSPIWGTEYIPVLASPPSPYGYDQDSIMTQMWFFDDAGNGFYVGPADSAIGIDNQIPYIDPDSCIANSYIYVEIANDVAPYTGYANVGEPTDNIYDFNGNGDPADDYDNRDKIIAHANMGDAFGADEVGDVYIINDPFCVDSLILYDDGTLGDDTVAGDKNYTGHARVEVGTDTTFCFLDTDEDSVYFDIWVDDDAGNAAILSACLGVKYDNEIPTITADNVDIRFWDDPETFGVDGDLDGDGIVTVGDLLIFEWRAEDEVWDDTEIDSVRVDAASIDPTYTGWINLMWDPSGGIYRNCVPDLPCDPYEITAGSVDGEELCADFKVWDNAGNTTGWKNFCSGLMLDNMGSIIDCADIGITISGDDDIATVGDTITFAYTGPIDDIANIGVIVGDLAEMYDVDLNAGNSWTASFVVESGTTDTDDFWFEVVTEDDVGNEYTCYAGPIVVDNQAPTLTCSNAYVRLWDYLDNIPYRIVNVGDNLTAVYFDVDGDVASVTVDFSNYDEAMDAVDMVFGFDGGPAYKWGYRVDPIPEGDLDQGPGGLGTLVRMTVYDDAGNSSSMWFCPIWFDEGVLPDPIATPADTTYMCNSDCVGADTDLPEPVDPEAITFELLEASNGIANVGPQDRLRIIVNMGDPTAPGYDMQWETSAVEADISQYGYGEYIDLTDGGWSAGGEGDGRFSYYFFFNEDDGRTWFEGAPVLPGEANFDAGDEGTKIRVRSMDDAGNYSADWTYSGVLVLEGTQEPVPVDNEIPVVDPDDISVSFVDNDDNGILDIGDEVTISVDMTDAEGGPVAAVYAYLYDWGYPSMDMVPLTAQSPVYAITFTVMQNEGEFCDGDLFEDESCLIDLLAATQPHPSVQVLAKDVSDNWSNYYWVGEPYMDPPPPHPFVDDWPFTYAWPMGVEFGEIIADTDAPDPVNWTYDEGGFDSGISAFSLPDGRIGIRMFYETNPRNTDVDEFFVYGDIATPDTVDWDTYLGAPIPAGSVPTSIGGMNHGGYVWISDMLPEREEAYHFGILARDNAGNMSDPMLTWITGEYADTSYFTGYVEVLNGYDQPTDIGGDDLYFLGYLNSEYWEVVYVEFYGRIKDLDPMTEGDQPGEWKLFEEDGEWPDGSWDFVEPPYHADIEDLLDEFSLVEGTCYEFEVVIIPWDESGNHMTLGQAEQYAVAFTYDETNPVIQWWTVDGDPSPSADPLVVTGSALIEAMAYDGCANNSQLTYMFYLMELGGGDIDYDVLLDSQTIASGETYTFTWDLAGYPPGYADIGLDVYDEAGNIAYFDRRTIAIQDLWAPGGRFANVKLDMLSHPEYTRLTDGMAIGSSEMLDLVFWVQWPGTMSSMDYDVEQVRVEYMLHGTTDEWTHIATLTDWGSTESWNGDLWYPYWFHFDTSGFSDGDEIDMKATVMDMFGNETAVTVTVMIAGEAPILAIDIPEATEVCDMPTVKGPFNITATETSTPYDTYLAFWAYKRSDEPDIDPDCNWTDGDGWIIPSDSLMILDEVTPETIWRATVDPSTEGMADGSWDFVVLTTDVAGNWSWDRNGDWCIDAGYFDWAVANGMGMTVVLQNEAPEVRIRSVNDFTPVDEGWLWPILVYVQTDDQVTVTSWTESDCDVDRIEYWLAGDDVTNGEMLVAMSDDEGSQYEATFPGSGGVGDYLVPGALRNGFVTVSLIARLYDVLGNYTEYWVDLTIIDISPTSAMITMPADGDMVGHMVALQSAVISGDEIYDVAYYYRPAGTGSWMHIATTRPHDGAPWDTDTNDETIYWNTDLLADGQYELKAVARDANLITDPNPPVITVTVDNTAPAVVVDVDPKVTTVADMTWIGGPFVEIMAGVTEAGGVEYCKFWYKPVEDDIGSATLLTTDYGAPFAYMWEGGSFTSRTSGWYDIIAEVKDFAGNTTIAMLTVYIDHCDPYGWIAQINDDQTPGGSNFFGVVTITGWMDDSDSDCSTVNQLMHSGLAGAQFQYNAGSGWEDLGGFIEDSGPTFTVDWDLSALVGQTISLRIAAVDAVGNWAYSDTITIYVIDTVADKAVIAGVDPVTGYVWAVPVIHGTSEDIGFVRFEYGDGESWTPIGTVDEYTSSGMFGTPWHAASAGAGTYWVRAVAFHDDWDPEDPDFAGLYDQDPAMMQVTVDEFGMVTMATTENITSLERWGNLHNCERIVVEAVSVDRPTIIVVFDNDPEDHFNSPWADWRDELIRPDDPSVWVDNFSVSSIDPWGTATIIATHNDEGIVGALTSTVNIWKIAGREGSRGPITGDNLTVDIPAGAFNGFDGLLIITVPELIADPSIDDPIAIGAPEMMTFLDAGSCDHTHFSNGVRAKITMGYGGLTIPEGYDEDDLRIAFWDQDDQEWIFDGDIEFAYPSVDKEAKTVSVYVDQTGTYSIVATKPLRITTPIFNPRCDGYTGVAPTFCTIIEDLKYDYIDEIMVKLDGPAEDVIFDDMIIYHGGGEEYEGDGYWWDYASEVSYGAGWFGTYDPTANRLCMKLVPGSDWSEYWNYWYDYEDWFLFFGDIISDGLPAGTYTLDIYAQNEMGDTEHRTHTFYVDATPPAVRFVDADGMPGPKYVDTYPTFYLDISDEESGIDFDEIYLDVFIVEPNGSRVEDEELLGTVTPSAMTYDAEMGYLIAEFGEIYRDELPEGYSLDVVIYNGEFTTCANDCEYGDCRCYYNEHGVADCAGNHATPVWRRFTVKRTEDPGPVVVADVISYPNPFDPAGGDCATISFSMTKSGHVTIAIYDFAGQYVTTIADDWYSSGDHEFTWCGTDGSGKVVASGAYIGYFKVDDNMKVVTKTLKIGVVNGGND